ncbi:MAG: branched-chain amino acid transport system II carrier protein, partial [Comamonas sp.]
MRPPVSLSAVPSSDSLFFPSSLRPVGALRMASSLSFRQFLSLSFFLFSMFLGAGNIIFAPPLGQAAGTNLWIAMAGFLTTGVGL